MTDPDVEGGCSSRDVPDIVQLKFAEQALGPFGHVVCQAVRLQFQTPALQTLLACLAHQSLHGFPVLGQEEQTFYSFINKI